MEVCNGRPETTAGRLEKELRCYDLLDSLNVSYQRIDHEAAMTMEACQQIDAALGSAICKNLLLCNRQKTDFYLLMLPGEKVFKTSVLSKEIGSARLSFADGQYMEEFLDITPGSLSVLGLMNDQENKVELLIDKSLLNDEFFGCHPCINTSSLKLSMKDLLEKILPTIHHAPRFVELKPKEETP